MVVDTSALIAVLLNEPETEAFVRVLADDPRKIKGNDFNKTDVRPVIEN